MAHYHVKRITTVETSFCVSAEGEGDAVYRLKHNLPFRAKPVKQTTKEDTVCEGIWVTKLYTVIGRVTNGHVDGSELVMQYVHGISREDAEDQAVASHPYGKYAVVQTIEGKVEHVQTP